MIFYFVKSRKATILLSVVLTAIGFIIMLLFFRNYTKFRIAYAIVPCISVYASLYIGKLIAYKSYQEILLLLYQKLDLEKFIKELETMIQTRISKKDKCLLVLHLSNGYIAAGDFIKAKSILIEYMSIAEKCRINLEFYSNLISALIQNKEIKQADIVISDLKNAICNEKSKDKKLRLQKTLAYQQACLEVMKGSNIYCDVLEKDYLSSKSILHKLNVSRYLIMLYKTSENEEKRKQIIDYILKYGNQHYMVRKIMQRK